MVLLFTITEPSKKDIKVFCFIKQEGMTQENILTAENEISNWHKEVDNLKIKKKKCMNVLISKSL